MSLIRSFKDYPSIDQIFHIIRDWKDAVFLDSSLTGTLGHFSIIGIKPYLKLENGEKFLINDIESEISFEQYVKTYLKENMEENSTDLPLISGAIGYFSYDYGRKKEKIPSRHPQNLNIPDCILTFYDLFIIEDHWKKELSLIANGHLESVEDGMLELEEIFLLANSQVQMSETKQSVFSSSDPIVTKETNGFVTADFTKEDYKTAVSNMIRYIIEGDIYVVNMTQQLQLHSSIPPYSMFQKLRRNNPAPFGAYMNYGDFQIVCASPERFLQMKDRKIQTRPIKGTRKRGATDAEDILLKEELENSEKDQSELLMIVDLERNDLNKVCIPGSVKVTELFKVETYATVFHLIANVVGQLRPELTIMDLIEAAFPGGSITGAPKLRAMELIDEQEHNQRNLYTGAIGYLSLNGDCDFNIVIRTTVYKDGIYHLGVGGGITYESELEFEYEETWQKAKALLQALHLECPV